MNLTISCRVCGFLQTSWRNFSASSTKFSGVPGVGTGKSARIEVDLDLSAEEYLHKNDLKPKDHPGVYHLKRIELPIKFVDAARTILSHENVKSLYTAGEPLQNYLWSRHLPIENDQYREKVLEIENQIQMKDDVLRPFLSEQQLKNLEGARDNKIRQRLKRSIYHWESINYDKAKGLQYLLHRSAPDYAALLQIFQEIKRRDEQFKPRTLYDFGSGIGTTIWALRQTWPKTLGEATCADISRDMNDLAESLLKGGRSSNNTGIPSLNFRQFFSESSKIPHEMVVSAFSLMELPSMRERLKVIDILWKKTNKYLVIVEQGSSAGFRAVIEARDYLLQLDRVDRQNKNHVFSPCPNETHCPRFSLDDGACKFYTKYRPLYPFHKDESGLSRFSYVVLRRGERGGKDEGWPRLISNPIIRKGHCICRVCTKEGRLSEIVLTKSKHSKILYRVGRKSHCGDLLPVNEIGALDVSKTYTPQHKDEEEEAGEVGGGISSESSPVPTN